MFRKISENLSNNFGRTYLRLRKSPWYTKLYKLVYDTPIKIEWNMNDKWKTQLLHLHSPEYEILCGVQ